MGNKFTIELVFPHHRLAHDAKHHGMVLHRELGSGVERTEDTHRRKGGITEVEPDMFALTDERVNSAIEADNVALKTMAQTWLRDTPPGFEIVDEVPHVG